MGPAAVPLRRVLDCRGGPHHWDTHRPRRIAAAQVKSGHKDAVLTGDAQISGIPVVLAVMDFEFMGGSMGSVVGEKLTRAAERAYSGRKPLVIVSASGGARMQEGTIALMQ